VAVSFIGAVYDESKKLAKYQILNQQDPTAEVKTPPEYHLKLVIKHFLIYISVNKKVRRNVFLLCSSNQNI